LLAELIDVLSREEFSDKEESQARQFLSILARNATVFTPTKLFKVVQEDSDDDVVLSTANEGRASHIVSGGKRLLKLGRFKGDQSRDRQRDARAELDLVGLRPYEREARIHRRGREGNHVVAG
jgi:predicted nucleic acid-binding protein